MRHPTCWTPLVVLCLLAQPPGVRAADPPGAEVGQIVRRALDFWQVPGAAVVIVRDGETIYLEGHGRKHTGRPDPVTPDTLFPLASCAKGFTSTLLAMLADEGKLAWDDPVRKHLPSFRLADPRADREVTLRDLLCHRTGVGAHDLLWYRAPWGTDEMIRRVGKVPPSHPFRSAFEYQSIMYIAAGEAAARAGGAPWDELMRRRIFGPLGMKSFACRAADAPEALRASGHRGTPGGGVEAVRWYEAAEPNAAGSVYGSARDLAAWLTFQLGDGTFRGRRLVSQENLAETHAPQMAIPLKGLARRMNPETRRLSYAMGWVAQDYRGRDQLSHGGTIDGFRAHITLLPGEKIGIGILNNLQGTRMNQALSNALVDHLLGLEPRDWNAHFGAIAEEERRAALRRAEVRAAQRVPGTAPRLPPGAYAGEYRDPAYGTATVRAGDGGLIWEWSSFRCPLRHYHFDTFELLGDAPLGGELLEFRFGAGGKVSGLKVVGVEFRRAGGGG